MKTFGWIRTFGVMNGLIGGWRVAVLLLFWGLTAVLVLSCSSTKEAAPSDAAELDDALCPSTRVWPGIAPGVQAEERTLEYWLEHPSYRERMDDVLMRDVDIAGHNQSMLAHDVRGEPLVADLASPLVPEVLEAEVARRLASLRRSFDKGEYFFKAEESATPTVLPLLDKAGILQAQPQRYVATGDVHVRCAPLTHSFYTATLDPHFDRNNCSVLKAGEPFVVVGDGAASDAGLPRLIRAGYTMGWIAADAPHTPEIPADLFASYVNAPWLRVRSEEVGTPRPNARRRLQGIDESAKVARAWQASERGLEIVELPVSEMELQQGSLTRGAFLREAFSFVGEEYGWGGREGFRDCSRLVLDSVQRFGLLFPRHSAIQQYAGSFWVDLEGLADKEKVGWIEEAHQRGVALLHMPGHIMVYLGKNFDGEPMALHSFAEYLEPCAEGTTTKSGASDTLVIVNQVDVSDLHLGSGTERRSFLARIDRVTVLGGTPGSALEGVATFRAAALPEGPSEACGDSPEAAIFSAPYYAHTQDLTTLVFASEHGQGALVMTAFSPSGRRIQVKTARDAGPPMSLVGQALLDEEGRWQIEVSDGDARVACRSVQVRSSSRERATGGGEAVWSARNAWDRRFENLYQIFIRELVRYPLDGDHVWQNMHDLLRVRERNILWNYLGKGEDEALSLQPDCADFPYMTRAYFAWKLGLPLGYRACSRGREGQPPRCDELRTQVQERQISLDVAEFQRWGRRVLMSTVHSGNGRTHPEDEASDLYPVALTRDALRPGTVYADPDGHVLMIARWEAQPMHGSGALVAVDAQPDGTIALRRFWRGTFAFRPETDSVGAGFKAFRPIVREGSEWRSLRNEELREHPDFAAYSLEQYEGSADDFYETMDALIYPRPQNARAVQYRLIDALEQSVLARRHSVRLGVEAMDARRWPEVPMPRGYSIFETSGLWEDFATPSRDMRLLVALDAVLNFAQVVERNPEQYGMSSVALEDELAALVDARDARLRERRFEYERSDGASWMLSLKDVVDRRVALEVAYNINDCAELRWGASLDSEEGASCRHRAPKVQQERMEEYRPWFHARRRPVR